MGIQKICSNAASQKFLFFSRGALLNTHSHILSIFLWKVELCQQTHEAFFSGGDLYQCSPTDGLIHSINPESGLWIGFIYNPVIHISRDGPDSRGFGAV